LLAPAANAGDEVTASHLVAGTSGKKVLTLAESEQTFIAEVTVTDRATVTVTGYGRTPGADERHSDCHAGEVPVLDGH
jgi:hypothetical protein